MRNPKTKHIHNVRLAGEANNNLIGRFQRIRRERDKVLRGMKVKETPTIEWFDIYYSFVSPVRL